MQTTYFSHSLKNKLTQKKLHVSAEQHINPYATELNPICNWGNLGSWQSVYTQL
jgi:hypothetical protein